MSLNIANGRISYKLQSNLRSAAYEALMEMVKNSPRDCYASVQKTTMIILEKLNQVLNLEGHITSQTDRYMLVDNRITNVME